jgi:hypothetical protein
MASVAFDTLKLAQGLEAAGFPARQAQDMASAFAEAVGDTLVTREHFDLKVAELDARLSEVRAATARDIAEAKADTLKWMFGAVGLQTLAILGGVAALLKLIGH